MKTSCIVFQSMLRVINPTIC